MKKYVITILVVLSMSLMLVGTAAAAPKAAGTATLVSVQYVPGKGPVFTFSVSGKFSRADLKGSLHVEGGADYNLHCTQVDESTVKCSASGKISGVNVSLTWGGSKYWVFVPEAPAPFCYSIWDWWEFTDYEWTDFGPHCQETPAHQGDIITYTVPDPDGSFEFPSLFLEENIFEGYCDAWAGPAYYYPGCPE